MLFSFFSYNFCVHCSTQNGMNVNTSAPNAMEILRQFLKSSMQKVFTRSQFRTPLRTLHCACYAWIMLWKDVKLVGCKISVQFFFIAFDPSRLLCIAECESERRRWCDAVKCFLALGYSFLLAAALLLLSCRFIYAFAELIYAWHELSAVEVIIIL